MNYEIYSGAIAAYSQASSKNDILIVIEYLKEYTRNSQRE